MGKYFCIWCGCAPLADAAAGRLFDELIVLGGPQTLIHVRTGYLVSAELSAADLSCKTAPAKDLLKDPVYN